jgi:hypothetical protein
VSRKTHPRIKSKHSRTHTRYHNQRWSQKRWGQAKSRYARLHEWHPDLQRANPQEKWEAHWPFTLSGNELSRNPFNLCSCWVCSYGKEDRRTERRLSKTAWKKDWAGSEDEVVRPLARRSSHDVRIDGKW